jgi:hypothetical protein
MGMIKVIHLESAIRSLLEIAATRGDYPRDGIEVICTAHRNAVAEAVAREREACARVAEQETGYQPTDTVFSPHQTIAGFRGARDAAKAIAAAIRARGNR